MDEDDRAAPAAREMGRNLEDDRAAAAQVVRLAEAQERAAGLRQDAPVDNLNSQGITDQGSARPTRGIGR